MDDQTGPLPSPQDRHLHDSSERVRIIGAEEAAEAMERGDVVPRRGGAIPRFGDRPPAPPAGPRPVLRFPLESHTDATRIERPPVQPPPAPATDLADLPSWGTESPSPAPVPDDATPDRDLDAWSSFASTAPQWDGDDIDDVDRIDLDAPNDDALNHVDPDPVDERDDELVTVPVGRTPAGARRRVRRRAERPAPARADDDTQPGDLFVGTGDTPGDPAAGGATSTRRVTATATATAGTATAAPRPDAPYDVADEHDAEPDSDREVDHEPERAEVRPARSAPADETPWYMRTDPGAQQRDDHDDGPAESDLDEAAYDDDWVQIDDDDLDEEQPPRRWRFPRPSGGGDDGGPRQPRAGGGAPPDRTRIVVGLALAAFAAVLFWIGSAAAMILVVGAVAFAALEYFNALRRAGYDNATLLGLVASIALPLAVYWRGLEAIPMIAALAVVFIFVWYLAGAGGPDPRVVQGTGTTVLGIMWIGLLGSFAAAMLRAPDGRGVLLVAVLATVAYDAVGFLAGQRVGRRPLPGPSPNKTIEGLVAGMVASVVVTLVVVGLLEIGPYDGLGAALLLGVAAAVAAPLGDLCESLLKRDLDVKDMGAILPGHGGVLDRFDALLFVLPAVFYVVHSIGDKI